jgi:hypothetical protein
MKEYDFDCQISECPENLSVPAKSFRQARHFAEEVGWKVEKINGHWYATCPGCVVIPHWSEEEEDEN